MTSKCRVGISDPALQIKSMTDLLILWALEDREDPTTDDGRRSPPFGPTKRKEMSKVSVNNTKFRDNMGKEDDSFTSV